MELNPTQLLAVLRVLKDVDDPSAVHEVQVDGQVIRDIPAVMQRAEQAFSDSIERLQEHEGDNPSGLDRSGLTTKLDIAHDQMVNNLKIRSWIHNVRGKLAAKVDRFADKVDAYEPDSEEGFKNFLYEHVLQPGMAVDGEVIRASEVRLKMKDGTGFDVDVSVTDTDATLDVRETDKRWSTAATLPVYIPFYGTAVHETAALAVWGKAKISESEGDTLKADAYKHISKKHAISGVLPIPLLSAFALVAAVRNLDRLRSTASVAEIAHLGEKRHFVEPAPASDDQNPQRAEVSEPRKTGPPAQLAG